MASTNLFSFLCILLLLIVQIDGLCNIYNCSQAITYQPLPNSKKDNATKVVRIGNIYNNAVDSMSLSKFAVATINNDTSILPDVKLELFSKATEAVLGTIAMAQDKNVSAIIANTGDDFASQVSTMSDTYEVPMYLIRSMDDAFLDKTDFPMMSRVFPTGTDLTEGMVAMIKSYNYSGAIVITTSNAHVSAGAATFQEQASNAGIPNVYVVTVNQYPNDANVASTALKCKAYIDEYQIRPIVLLTSPATGALMLSALVKLGLYDLLAYEMSRYVLTRSVANDAAPALSGAMLFFTRDSVGARYSNVSAAWGAADTTYFKGTRPSPGSQWFVYDAVYAYAYALDAVIKSGKDVSQVTTKDILSATTDVSFNGVSGMIQFDSNRDYVNHNGYLIYNMYSYNKTVYTFKVASIYSPVTKNFTQLVPYVFYNGSAVAPNPGYCKVCVYGTCSAESICVCFAGYKGEYCTDLITHHKDKTLPIVLPIVGFIVVVAAILIWYFKKRREQLVKEIQLQQRSEISRNEIKIITRIGRGASGEVFKATFRGTEVAVKSLITMSTSSDAIESFKMETAIMCTLRHPNIVLFMGSCFDPEQKDMLIVMEFCTRGSLHDLLYQPKTTLSYDLILHLACQAAQGMNFLHESNPPIIHRDLKSHNILLDDKFNAKISDFGITKFKESNKKFGKQTNKPESLGTVFWTAPEVLGGEVHTEKSDCYSFGIVLWEMMHRSDPYPGMDIVTVAMDVLNKGIRPVMNPTTPQEMQDLITDCWQQDQTKRPNFTAIMMRLRNLSMQHPLNTFTTGRTGVNEYGFAPPTGNVFFVFSRVESLFELFDEMPRGTKTALALHNQLIRTNLELYEGYEVKMMKDGFFLVFSSCADAINWCLATQVSLLHLQWPQELLDNQKTAEVMAQGKSIWRGLRVCMSIHSATPNTEIDPATGRMNYIGPEVVKARAVLKSFQYRSIVAEPAIMDECNTKRPLLIEEISTKLCDQSGGEILYQILPKSLQARQNHDSHNSPAYIVTSLEETAEDTTLSFTPTDPRARPSWLIPYSNLTLLETVGRGSVGDYKRAQWDNKEVVAKLLVNQKLREEDLIGLISDVAGLCKISHPNLLPVHGLCLKQGYISVIMDYVPGGSLRDLLSKDVPLSISQLIKIAKDIAVGMHFLTTHSNKEYHIHDNFKSNNILVSKDLDVFITDYAQTNIKDLARTMTSIASVAWTAPEILNGEPMTTASSVYSFGIVLWEMFTRKLPWDGEHPLKAVAKILNGTRPPVPDCPQGIKLLIQSCWHAEPEQRPSWHVILSELHAMAY